MSKILIIEDQNEVRKNLAEMLVFAGYKILEANNGVSGIKIALDDRPDLILCDIIMPEMDGYDTLNILSLNPYLMHIPVIFLTAKSQMEDFRKGMSLGASDYITKPFKTRDLLDAISLRLRKSKSLHQKEKSGDDSRQFYNEARADKDLIDLSGEGQEKSYKNRAHIYKEEELPKWLYFVVEGRVKSVQINQYGKALVSRIYSKGDYFGYISIVRNIPYDHHTRAMEPTVLRLISSKDFNYLLLNNRDFSTRIVNMLANHADYSEKQAMGLVYSSVRKRVAEALLEIRDKSDSGFIDISREDLAMFIATTRESVTRTLSDFKKEGLIEIDEVITIKDQAGLMAMPE